jgi:hypothetical protein
MVQGFDSFGAQMDALVPPLADMANNSVPTTEQVGQAQMSGRPRATTIELESSHALPVKLSGEAHSVSGAAAAVSHSNDHGAANWMIARGQESTQASGEPLPDLSLDNVGVATSAMEASTSSMSALKKEEAAVDVTVTQAFKSPGPAAASAFSGVPTTSRGNGMASTTFTAGAGGSGGRRLQSVEVLAGPLAGLGRNGRRMQVVSDNCKVL